MITWVGSGYGSKMRSDEFPARLILNALKSRDIPVRSPNAKRLWTFDENIIEFYTKLIENLDQYIDQTLHCVGNHIVKNIVLAKMVTNIAKSDISIKFSKYDPGDLVDGKLISFDIESQSTMWNLKFPLKKGLTKTYK